MSISLNKLKKPCLEYHLGMCSAPCAGKINEREYKVQIDKFRKFLNGDTDQIVKDLEKEMVRLSKLLEFEKAANIRDLIFKGYIVVYFVYDEKGIITVFGFTKYKEDPFNKK